MRDTAEKKNNNSSSMLKQIIVFAIFILCLFSAYSQSTIFVSPNGNDHNNGISQKPFKTLQRALHAIKLITNKNAVIEMRGGVYYLDSTLVINADGYQLHALVIRAYKNEKVIISGAKPVSLQWQVYKPGIYKAPVDFGGNSPDRLFFNGLPLSMARYPNFDSTARVFNGTAADAISDEKIKQWHNPAGGYVHALHKGEWGGFHYRITGKDARGKLMLEGGWQNNRPSAMHTNYRFVENIFEELDAPGEWFYDATEKMLYVYPPKNIDIHKALITVAGLKELIIIKGTAANPIKNISIEHIQFMQTARTFMLTREPLLRSDWTIYRGGAVLLDGTENCIVNNCVFSEIGGNAVFLSNYNKQDTIKDNHLYNIGGSGIAFVGNPDAVRSPVFAYEKFIPWDKMDFTPGPINDNYPQQCMAEGNLIHNIGTIEKQVAGVQIEMASHITVSHNSIYKTPRSGINIGDGCWGGHILEFNDVFNTVLETGDHGAFNSWGRDRFWRADRKKIDSIVAAKPGIELLDVVDPIIIRNNRFQCDHGWDIDLDDGSTNYRIYNNICLSGGLKLREGYHRIVYNNIMVNNTFHPHVWLKNSGDVFVHNIVTTSYAPILMDNWGKEIDSNFFLSRKGLTDAIARGTDLHSAAGDALFVNTITGNYHVKTQSPARQTGFKNFDMNTGVVLPELKKLAAKPPVRPLIYEGAVVKSATAVWLGAMLKSIETLGERSAAGLPDNKGAMIINVPAGTLAFKNGLQKADVIIKMNGTMIESPVDLLSSFQKLQWLDAVEIDIVRDQSVLTKKIVLRGL